MSKNQREIDGFQSALNPCQPRDIRFEGYPYTWSNNRKDEADSTDFGLEFLVKHVPHALW